MATQTVTQAEREVMDFLLAGPSLHEIAHFRLSPDAAEQLSDLLEAKRESQLASEAEYELERYLSLEHFMRMLKIEAHYRLQQQAS